VSFDAPVAGNAVGPTFANPHYFGAAATMFGTDVKVWYEYAGKTYAGTFAHSASGKVSCTICHDPKASKHTFEAPDPTVTAGTVCTTCHTNPTYVAFGAPPDATLATHKANIAQLSADLKAAMRAYTIANGMTQVCYDGAANPYFFTESATPGVCTTTQYKFNTKLMRAAYNYQWSQKEPNAWVHNYKYAAQVLFDAISELGGTTIVARP
jgi:hypothetical protein